MPIVITFYVFQLKLRNQVTTEQEKLLIEKNKEMEEIRKDLEQAKSFLKEKSAEVRCPNQSKQYNNYSVLYFLFFIHYRSTN